MTIEGDVAAQRAAIEEDLARQRLAHERAVQEVLSPKPAEEPSEKTETVLDSAVAFSSYLPQLGAHPTMLFEMSQRARLEAHTDPAIKPPGQSGVTMPKLRWGFFSAIAAYIRGEELR